MKRLVIFLTFAAAAAISIPALSGELTITVTDSEAVEAILRNNIAIWVADPVNATGCDGGDCCVSPATDDQCIALARSALDNPDRWMRAIFPCIQADASWRCHIEYRRGVAIAYCETIPGGAGPQIEDVSRCLSEQAEVQFD